MLTLTFLARNLLGGLLMLAWIFAPMVLMVLKEMV